MARGKRDGLLIAGGGLAGALAALAMARARPEVPILLVEEEDRFGGDHLWSFFEAEIDAGDRWLVEPLIGHSWPGYYVAFPEHSRKIKAGYHSVRSAALDHLVRTTLRPDQYRLGTRIVAVRENELILGGGEKIRADGVIDARGGAHLAMLDVGWRTSLVRDYRFKAAHGLDRPVLMDATMEQRGACRFVSCLPFDGERMEVADIRYSRLPEVAAVEPGGLLEAYVVKRGWGEGAIEREQVETLPLVTGGDFGAFWRVGGARVAKFGCRGGFFHPTTGAVLADAVRTAALLARQRDFGGAALHSVFEGQALGTWKKREVFRAFNAALLDTAAQALCPPFDRLYRLSPGLIGRFHAGVPTMFDKMRILGGKPAIRGTD